MGLATLSYSRMHVHLNFKCTGTKSIVQKFSGKVLVTWKYVFIWNYIRTHILHLYTRIYLHLQVVCTETQRIVLGFLEEMLVTWKYLHT